MTNVLNALSKSEVWQEASALANPTYVFKCFLYVNTNYLSKLDTKGTNNTRIMNKAHAKSCTPLYLTNDTDTYWTSYLVKAHGEFVAAKAITTSQQNKDAQKRSSLPKAIRMATWNFWFPNQSSANCFICKSHIDINYFECGHIVSRHNGGTDNVSNLRPICSLCNKSMGKENMNEFCKQYGISMFPTLV
jgi:hypothetical protein